MKARAAVILIENDKIALIERYRLGKHYLVFPGGKIESGEIAAFAAQRELKEELGLDIEINQMIAEVWYEETPQFYFLGRTIGGHFGLGTGKEMSSLPESNKGSHHPVWIPVDDLLSQPVFPKLMAEFVLTSHHSGWPEQPLIVTDQPSDDPL
jgi:8-oxo-dGTP diphosphatase